MGLLPAGADAAVEGDIEGVERGLPAVGPAPAPTAGGVQADDGQIQVLERGLLVGEVPVGLDRAAEPRVEAPRARRSSPAPPTRQPPLGYWRMQVKQATIGT